MRLFFAILLPSLFFSAAILADTNAPPTTPIIQDHSSAPPIPKSTSHPSPPSQGPNATPANAPKAHSSTSTAAPPAATSNICSGDYGGGCNANDVDPADGASGTDTSSINFSTGGFIAIAVIVGIVVLLGVTSTILFVVAKKRNWEVRKTIVGASRRLTGRSHAPQRRQTRRQGAVRMQSSSNNRARDIEKGRNTRDNGAMEMNERTARYPGPASPPNYSERP